MTDENTIPPVDPVVTEPTPTAAAEPVKRKGVYIANPIVEKGEGKYPGSLVLPTYTRAELERYMASISAKIESEQPARLEMVSQGQVAGLNRWDISDTTSLYITDNEAAILTSIRTSLKGLYPAHDESEFFNPEDELTNLPSYSAGGRDIPIAIMGVQADKVTDPVARVKTKLGLSVPNNIPLWNSGFRIEVAGPSTIEQLNLETKLLIEKIDISYDTYGYALTSANIWMDRILIEFFLDRVVKSTAGTTDPEKLMRLIALTDYDTISLGVAATLFPDGYTLERDVFREVKGELTATKVKSKLNAKRMLAVKNSQFTLVEKQRLAKMAGVIDVKTLKEHRQNLRADVDRFVQIDDTYLIKLKIPTLEEYLRIGLTWHTHMEERVNKVLASTSSEAERKIFLARSSEIARVMFLAHWVDGIYEKPTDSIGDPVLLEGFSRLDPDEHSHQDVAAADKRIEQILEDLSASPSKCDKILEGIEKFSNKMRTTSAIITREPGATASEGAHPHVVTINPAELFFTLLRHKILMAGG